jgi:hypothetical protein
VLILKIQWNFIKNHKKMVAQQNTLLRKRILKIRRGSVSGTMVHACNPNDSMAGGEDYGLRPALGKNARPYLKNN